MTVAEDRELLGVTYCPTCKQDTIPSDVTGRCFFCERQLVQKGDPKDTRPICACGARYVPTASQQKFCRLGCPERLAHVRRGRVAATNRYRAKKREAA